MRNQGFFLRNEEFQGIIFGNIRGNRVCRRNISSHFPCIRQGKEYGFHLHTRTDRFA